MAARVPEALLTLKKKIPSLETSSIPKPSAH